MPTFRYLGATGDEHEWREMVADSFEREPDGEHVTFYGVTLNRGVPMSPPGTVTEKVRGDVEVVD
jgi:hypothetical protein